MKIAFAALVIVALAATAPARADDLARDRDSLSDCIAEAFPEGDLPASAVAARPKEIVRGGDCIGLIERADPAACAASSSCVERETKAWLALARGVEARGASPRNKAAIQTALGGVLRQAKAICLAAAAASAWGAERVAKGQFSEGLDSRCVRDAVAGLVAPMVGYSRGN